MNTNSHRLRRLQKIGLLLLYMFITACYPRALIEPTTKPEGTLPFEIQTAVLNTPSPLPSATTGQTAPYPTSNPDPIQTSYNNLIYVGLRRNNIEIWEYLRESKGFQLIYQGPPGSILLGEGEEKGYLSQETVAVLREKQELDPDPTIQNAEEIQLDGNLTGLTLSPAGDFLAWSEQYENCPGNYCYGQHTIKVMSLVDQALIIEKRTHQYFSFEPIWSPDGRYLAFHEFIRGFEAIPPTLWVFDTLTSEVEVVGQGAYPVWSPDSRQIAALYTDNPYNKTITEMRIYTLDAHTWSIIQPSNWDEFKSPTWSPDGSKLAFIALRNRQLDKPLSSIIVLDRQTQEWTEIYSSPPNYYLEKIHWFPDGDEIIILRREDGSPKFYELGKLSLSQEKDISFISTVTSPVNFGWSIDNQWLAVIDKDYELRVLNVQTGATLVHLQNVYIKDWQWSASGREILLLADDFDSKVQMLQVLNLPEEKINFIVFPDEFEGFIYGFTSISITW